VPGSSKTPVSKPSDSVRVEFDDPVEIIIRGQTELIHRALDNVIRNAVQHTPAEGIVQVNTRLERDEHRLHLIVFDEGPGVPKAQLSSIFEPFFRGENRQEKEGSALGLAIAGRALEARSSKINACNRPNGGLCIEMDLPIAQRQRHKH
jgi:two-component system OmpR family sensor kinase